MIHFSLASGQEIRHTLCERLRAQRLLQGLTQQELAARAGISASTLKRLEKSGDASFEAAIRVVQALGLAGELQTLFEIQTLSIAQMERAAQATRLRAPRTRQPSGKSALTPTGSQSPVKAVPRAKPGLP